MTTTFRAFRRETRFPLNEDIQACIAWEVRYHKPAEVHLNPSVVTGESVIDGLPIIPDKYIPAGEIWIGFEKE